MGRLSVGGQTMPVLYHLPSSSAKSWSMLGIGSFSRMGGEGVAEVVPVLEKAPDFIKNSDRAVMPSFVPRRVGRWR